LMDVAVWTDEYEDGNYYFVPDSEWNTISFPADDTFSHILIELYTYFVTGEDLTDVIFEIDYLQVTTPDSMGEWDSWQPCLNDTLCALSDMGTSTWLQYKLDLTTTDQSASPVVHSVTYQGDYLPTGTYTSQTETFNRSQELLTFNANVATSASTSVSFEYSTNGTTWSPINPGDNFPQNTVASQVTWRATLNTSDPRYTPIINCVSITSATVPKTQATSIPKRVAALEAEGKTKQANELRTKYPDSFNPDGSPRSKEVEIVVILTEISALLEKLIKQRDAE